MHQDLAKTILGNIGDGIISIDASRKIVFANPAACAVFGVEPKAIVNCQIEDVMTLAIYDDNCLKSSVDPLGHAISSGETVSYKKPMIVDSVKDRIVYIEDTASPIRGDDGNIIGAVMVFRDVTDEVQMRCVIEENRQALIRANSILSAECEVARGLAASKGGINEYLKSVLKHLKAKWISFATVGDGWVGGTCDDQHEAVIGDPQEIFSMTREDLAKVKQWIATEGHFIGERNALPKALLPLSRDFGGHCVAVPVSGGNDGGVSGVFVMASNNGHKWSRDEGVALGGLATMFCLLAKSEKNREDLSRKIQGTLQMMVDTVVSRTVALTDKESC